MHIVAGPERTWRPPALSSLVNRLNQPAASPTQQLPYNLSTRTSPGPPQPEQVYLDASSDEDEPTPAPAVAEATAAVDSQQTALSIYTVAAEPFKALLAVVATPPGDHILHAVCCDLHAQSAVTCMFSLLWLALLILLWLALLER